MKTLKTAPKQPNPYARKILVPFKVNAEEMRKLLGAAHAYTKGNISAWVRYASLHFKPAKGDLEK